MAKGSRRSSKSSTAVNPRREGAQRFMPIFLGIIISIAFLTIGLTFPGLGPALPSTPEMWTIMMFIIIIGMAVIVYSAVKVIGTATGNVARGISFIIGGLILFVSVTVLDVPIHTGSIEFSQLTHTLWHITELVGVIMMGMGLHKIAQK